MKTKSLKGNVFLYFIIFSLSILFFLWIFQILFLKYYYESYKTNELSNTLNVLKTTYNDNLDTLYENLDKYAYDYGICSEVLVDNILTYTTNPLNRGCLNIYDQNNKLVIYNEKNNFINNNDSELKLRLINKRLNNKTLIYGVKLDNNIVIFANTSIDPIDSTVNILKKQFTVITVIIIVFAILIAYFISNKLTKPILHLTKNSKSLSKGNFDTNFDINTDIQELRDLADSLNYTKEVLKNNEELRRDLMANVSHDLKTPLTMIKAYAEMVRDISYKDKEKRENDLNVIIDEVDRLNLLVNDILELSKLEKNIETINYEEINFSRLVKAIINRFQIYSLTEKYNFNLFIKDNIIIKADKQKLEQVIYNLVSNAVNYTDDKKNIYITVIEKNNNIRVAITDTGKGISDKDLPNIWYKYYKNDKKHKRNMVGTGLGLSIVKNVLEAHHYPYGVITKKNKGTTFYFVIKR